MRGGGDEVAAAVADLGVDLCADEEGGTDGGGAAEEELRFAWVARRVAGGCVEAGDAEVGEGLKEVFDGLSVLKLGA